MTYLIAETGINHGGNKGRLFKLVHLAADSGFDAVKFQWWDVATLKRPKETLAKLAPLQMSGEGIKTAATLAISLGLDPIVSVFTPGDIKAAKATGVPWKRYKLSHVESLDDGMVNAVLEVCPRPLLSAKWGHDEDDDRDLADVLWCCGDYPTRPQDVDWWNLGHYAGFSDHTGLVWAGACAAAHWAKIIEVHITDHKDGPDAAVSIDDPAMYVRLVREIDAQS